MVYVIGSLTPCPGKKEELRKSMEKGIAQIEANEPGCEFFRLFEQENGNFFLIKKFKDVAAYESYKNNTLKTYMLGSIKKSKDEGILANDPTVTVFENEAIAGFGPR